MPRVILHADLNNFYASVACLGRPGLREVPMAVCGDPSLRHGVVLAKNMPAKRLGIKTGQALWQARQLCPQLQTVAPDFEEVMRISGLVREIFSRYTSQVQPFGVDEAWLDLSQPGMTIARGEHIANHLRHTVREETGLTVSVGVGDSRVFAKLGSDLKKPDAVCVVCTDNRKETIDPLPVNDLLFVGRATAQKLNGIGVYTVGQLACAETGVLKALLGKTGAMLSAFARGDDASCVLSSEEHAKLKSVGNSVTTARDITTCQDARVTLLGLCESVAGRMRRQAVCGRVVQIVMRDHRLHTIQRQRTLDDPTCCSGDLFRAAFGLLEQHWGTRVPLRSLGVSVSQLTPVNGLVQISFLPEDARRQRQEVLERAVDHIRSRYGRLAVQRAVMLAGSGCEQMREYRMNPLAM